jgi:hypothetical protein
MRTGRSSPWPTTATTASCTPSSQVDRLLHTVNRDTLQVSNVVAIRIPVAAFSDVTALAYDPGTDTLYATIGHWDNYPAGPTWDELAKVDPWTGDSTVLGRIDGPWITSLAFSESEGVLYALGVAGAGSWDSPDATQVLRIDPATAAFTTVYVTPYHAMLGMAFKEPATFYSWINEVSRYFGQIDLAAQVLTPLGSDAATGAIGAMLLKTFDLPAAPVPPLSAPVGFLFEGHVTDVSDPLGRLKGQVRKGQSFRGQINYDAGLPFKEFVSGDNSLGIALQSGKLRYIASTYAAETINNRLETNDQSPTDQFRLRADTPSGAVISWTLVDTSGNAVDTGDSLPQDFDLSRWQTNVLTVAAYDACCRDPIYSFSGRVDDIRRRPGPAPRPLPRQARR